MDKGMTCILTGDIVNSRKENPELWQKKLKKVLNKYGNNPSNWEIFRGDMFQVETHPERSLQAAIELKAEIKQLKDLDTRIAIGIGLQEFRTNKITESNGQAYINSGLCFEGLKKRKLAIKTPWKDFDEEWNLHLRLASLIMDNWRPTTALILKKALENPQMNQKELARHLKRSQSTISESLNRAGYDTLQSMILKFSHQIVHHLNIDK